MKPYRDPGGSKYGPCPWCGEAMGGLRHFREDRRVGEGCARLVYTSPLMCSAECVDMWILHERKWGFEQATIAFRRLARRSAAPMPLFDRAVRWVIDVLDRHLYGIDYRLEAKVVSSIGVTDGKSSSGDRPVGR